MEIRRITDRDTSSAWYRDTSARPNSHYFDWDFGGETYSTDSEFPAKDAEGLMVAVFCDGVEILEVVRFRSGKGGWIECVAPDEFNHAVIERLDRDGNPTTGFATTLRLVYQIVRGDVTYQYLPFPSRR